METIRHDRLCKAYWDIWAQVQSDPEYARLRAELEALEPGCEAILSTLPAPDRQTLDRYVTLRETMSRRMLECACEEMVSPK